MSAPVDQVKAPVYLSDEEEFSKFKVDFKKTYESDDEEYKRFNLFKENLQRIRDHNDKFNRGETTYTQGINQFADLTHDEFKQRCCGVRRPDPQTVVQQL